MQKSKKTLYKLNQKFVEQLPLINEGNPKIYFDATVKGFGVCIGRTSKSYILQREVKGKSVRVTFARTTELSVCKAREKATQLLLEMRNGNNPNESKHCKDDEKPDSITLQVLLEQHLQSLQLKGCETSAESYPRTLNNHIKDWLLLPVESITRQQVTERHRKIGLEVGTRSANAVFRMLRALYNLYRIDNPDFHNPVEILSLKKLWFPEKPRDVRLKPHEMKKWLQALSSRVVNPVHREYMLFILLNGLRKNEGMNLKWSEVDFSGKSFRIEKTKNKKPLELPMTDFVEGILKRLRSMRDEKDAKTSEWVFPSALSETGHLREVKKSLAAANKYAGTKIRLHDLRRTFVSIANSIKIPQYTIKKLVNHSSGGDVTASVYNVMDIDDLRESMQAITDHFRKLMEIEPLVDGKVIAMPFLSVAMG